MTDWKKPWNEIRDALIQLPEADQQRIIAARAKRTRKQLKQQKLTRKNQGK